MEDRDEILTRIDQTLERAIEAFVEGKEQHRFSLEELQLKIRLIGPRWSGVVDKPVAKFLIDLDDMLTDEFREQGIAIPEKTQGIVALEVREGSWDALLKYSKDILAAFTHMTPGQQILIIATVLAAMGIFKAADIIKALNSVKEKELDNQKDKIAGDERVRLVEAVSSIRDDERRLQKPLRSLVGKMGDGDKIELPAQEKPLLKAEAKTKFTPATRSKSRSFYVDHPYKVEELLTKDPDNWQIGLSFGDFTFRARLLISEEEVSQMLRDFQEAHEKGSAIAPSMHVSAKISDKGIQSASVVGLGTPRENAVTLSSALEQARSMQDEEGDEEVS